MKKVIPLVLCLLSFTSCGSKEEIQTQYSYHDNGAMKPKVALIPMLDSTTDQSFSALAQEFTESVQYKLFSSGKLFLTNDFDSLRKTQVSLSDTNPFLEDLDWLYETGSSSEFVVFLELIDYKLSPKNGQGGLLSNYSLDIKFRTKVIDIRQKEPKVILQEVLEETFSIPWRPSNNDTNSTSLFSPIGRAHHQMIKKVYNQIQDYILLAKSK